MIKAIKESQPQSREAQFIYELKTVIDTKKKKKSPESLSIQKHSTDFRSGVSDSGFDTMKWNWEKPSTLLQAAPFADERREKKYVGGETKLLLLSH